MVIDPSKLKELLTLSEVCRLFNVHPNTLRNWDRSGTLKAIRIGTRKDRRYRKDEVLSFFYGKKSETPKVEKIEKTTSFDFQNLNPPGSALPPAEKPLNPEGGGKR